MYEIPRSSLLNVVMIALFMRMMYCMYKNIFRFRRNRSVLSQSPASLKQYDSNDNKSADVRDTVCFVVVIVLPSSLYARCLHSSPVPGVWYRVRLDYNITANN